MSAAISRKKAEIDVEFHHAVGECAHNIILLHTLRSCYRLLSEGVFQNRMLVFTLPGAREELLAQHRAIHAAVMSGSPAAARKAAMDHITYVERSMAEAERSGRLAKGVEAPAAPALRRKRRNRDEKQPCPAKKQQAAPRVGLFVTCLVDLFRPSIGFAALKLLEEAGCEVEVPVAQTCCGQLCLHSGDRDEARAMAETTIEAFEGFDHVVTPSGACAGMLAIHYPALFEDDPKWQARATALRCQGARVDELPGRHAGHARGPGPPRRASVTYHDACAGLHDLGVEGAAAHAARSRSKASG